MEAKAQLDQANQDSDAVHGDDSKAERTFLHTTGLSSESRQGPEDSARCGIHTSRSGGAEMKKTIAVGAGNCLATVPGNTTKLDKKEQDDDKEKKKRKHVEEEEEEEKECEEEYNENNKLLVFVEKPIYLKAVFPCKHVHGVILEGYRRKFVLVETIPAGSFESTPTCACPDCGV
eukprot:TRINITY_DN48968_c0_g1_i2.p1 TRINITY_DN48968_c0_g1~~TRINITY_DN48968_c0_g1_i2.p1  ORF type:complete len:183 (+),score=32.43 TRINITY_DN48968_c0_g1_i2:26-550(+)